MNETLLKLAELGVGTLACVIALIAVAGVTIFLVRVQPRVLERHANAIDRLTATVEGVLKEAQKAHDGAAERHDQLISVLNRIQPSPNGTHQRLHLKPLHAPEEHHSE